MGIEQIFLVPLFENGGYGGSTFGGPDEGGPGSDPWQDEDGTQVQWEDGTNSEWN